MATKIPSFHSTPAYPIAGQKNISNLPECAKLKPGGKAANSERPQLDPLPKKSQNSCECNRIRLRFVVGDNKFMEETVKTFVTYFKYSETKPPLIADLGAAVWSALQEKPKPRSLLSKNWVNQKSNDKNLRPERPPVCLSPPKYHR